MTETEEIKRKTNDNRKSITTGWMKSFLAKPFKDGNRIITDAESKGLELRVHGDKAAWVARYKGKMKTLAWCIVPAGSRERRIVTSPQEIRQLNDYFRMILETDEALLEPFLLAYFEPAEWQRHARTAFDSAKAAVARTRSEEVHDNAWTLQQALDNFIEKRRRPDQRKPIKESYAVELRSTFARKEFADVINLPLTKLTAKAAEDIRDALEKKAGVSPSKKAVTAIRTVMKYTYEQHRGQSGLEGMQPWWLMLTTDTVIKPRHRNPGIEGIGKTLALAEYYLDHPLPGRVGVQHGVRDNVFSAFLWIVLSAQRQGSGLQLKAADLKPYPGREGWFIAVWQEGVMKNGRRFVLPVSPRMYAVLKPAMDRGRHECKSGWAFPSEDTADGEDIHVNRSATLAVLRRLAGRDNLMKGRADAVDLLALNGIDYWSPHDTRNAVTAAMDEAGIPGGASVLLAHTINADDKKMTEAQFAAWVEQRIADITRASYGDIQHLDLKSKAIAVWTDAVLDAWERARREGVLVAPGKRVVLDPAPAAETDAVAA